MSTTSVGQIGLDLVVNQKQFNKQMSGIQSLASKVGKSLAAAFAVKKIVDFGKECVNLGSDLQEVQNVVEVTFPNMTAKVNEFAKSAAASFGLSETMAKKFTGTFGSMAKAFGFSEQQAYEMGSALTGLAGDVASFYNLTQEEAYTKLKSVFTGETESLKDLGVVMTQTALDSYALANGFGKTTKAMSEAEKVALRYAFVQEQLSAASGDFARTSDSWANQTRILKLQFDSLKATMGQGLINVLTPVLKVVNVLLGKLSSLAEGFKAFSELLTGNKASESSLSSSVSDADALANSIEGVGNAAEASKKKVAGLADIDELNILSQSLNGLSESNNSNISIDYGTLAEGETVLEKTSNQFQSIVDKANELRKIFTKGFKISFGDSEKKIENISLSLKSIGESLENIFKHQDVSESANKLVESIVTTAGYDLGAISAIGLIIGDNLTEGISISLESNKDFIRKRLVNIFDAKNEVAKKNREMFASLKNIYEAFSSTDGKKITAGITSIYTDAYLTIEELGARFNSNFASLLVDPFVNNSENLKLAVEETLGPVAEIVDTASQGIKESCEDFLTFYDEKIDPLFDSFTEGISDIVEELTTGYNQDIAPVLDSMGKKFDETWGDHIQPLIDQAIELGGTLSDTISMLWTTVLQPLLQWCAENIMPVLGPILSWLGESFLSTFGTVCDIVSDLFDALESLLNFIEAVFLGDWATAWDEAKNICQNAFNALAKLIKVPINQIIDALNAMIRGLNKISFEIPDWVPELGGEELGFNIPTIPKLAQGGYVKANTPQLAIIGDNRHQGEIVAPEDKLEQMALKVARMVNNGGDQTGNELMRQALVLLQGQNELLLAILEKETGITANDLFDSVRKSADSYTKRTGNPAFPY